jgi:hypothetical protein
LGGGTVLEATLASTSIAGFTTVDFGLDYNPCAAETAVVKLCALVGAFKILADKVGDVIGGVGVAAVIVIMAIFDAAFDGFNPRLVELVARCTLFCVPAFTLASLQAVFSLMAALCV